MACRKHGGRGVMLEAMLSAVHSLCLLAVLGQTAAQKLPVSVVPVIDEAPMKAKSYDWMGRHQAAVERVKKGGIDLLFIGDSITHGWEGGGRELWNKYYAPRNAVNLGFGWDRTEHVLWRLQNGEVDGIRPKVAVLLIGVNNLGANHSVDDTVTGIEAVIGEINHRLPSTKILLLGVLPWKENPTDPQRLRVNAVNARLAKLDGRHQVTYLNINDRFLRADGTMSRLVMPDMLHPNRRGYQLWADEMEPTLARLLGDSPRG